MAIKSQLRLTQITGSLGAGAGQINDATAAVTTAAADLGDMAAVMSHVASAIKRVHGDTSGAFANTASTLKDAGNTARISYIDSAGVLLNDENGNLAVSVGGASGTDKTLTAKGRVLVDDATDATSATDGSLQTDGGLSVAKAIYNDTAATLAATSGVVTMGSSTAATVSAAGILNVNNVTDATSKTDGSLQTDGGLSVAKAIFNGTGATLASDSGVVTMGSTTAATISAAGILNVNNETEATSTTDGSLQTDGGLSVVKSAVIGDDLDLLSDSSILSFGAGKDISFTHDGSTGMAVASAGKFDISAGASSVIKTTAGDLTIDSDAGKVILTGSSGADSIHVQASATFDGDLVVAGNLDINGTTTTIDVANLAVDDELIILNRSNSASPVNDIGFVFQRGNGSSTNQANKIFVWDESEDKFALAAANTEDGTTAGNITIGGYEGLMIGSLDLRDGNISNGGGIEADQIMVADAANGLNINFNGANTGTGLITLKDNVADALSIADDAADWLVFRTVTASPRLEIGQDARLGATKKLEFNGNTDYIQLNTDLKIVSAAGIELNADGQGVNQGVAFLDNATIFGRIRKDGSNMVLSASAGGAVVISGSTDSGYGLQVVGGEGQTAGIAIAADQADDNSDAWAMVVDAGDNDFIIQQFTGSAFDQFFKIKSGGARIEIGKDGADQDVELKFMANTNDGVIEWKEDEDYFLFADDIVMNGTEKVQFGGTSDHIQLDTNLKITAGTAAEVIAPYLQIGNGSTNEARIRLLEDADNGSNYITFGAPAALGGNYTFMLPDGNGTSGFVLSTNGSGVTSWVAQGGAENSVKTVSTISGGSLAANGNLSANAGYSATDYSSISTANASKAIDVFVNGQLLASGSGPYTTDTSQASFTSGDYLAKTLTMNALDIKFAFALENDDVVTIIGRA